MTTSRERYEAKTRVVTFRVPRELFDQIEAIKARSNLSNADLVKLGAGIAEAEIKNKLAELSGLSARLSSIKVAIAEQTAELNKERERHREEIEKELNAYRLFSAGWRVETVAFKLGIAKRAVREFYQNWATLLGEKEKAEQEILRDCLEQHRLLLMNQSLSLHTDKERDQLLEALENCNYLLSHPSAIDTKTKEFLLAQYSPSYLRGRYRKTV